MDLKDRSSTAIRHWIPLAIATAAIIVPVTINFQNTVINTNATMLSIMLQEHQFHHYLR